MIEPFKRFIQYQQFRILEKCLDQQRFPHFSIGKLLSRAVQQCLQSRFLDQVLSFLIEFSFFLKSRFRFEQVTDRQKVFFNSAEGFITFFTRFMGYDFLLNFETDFDNAFQSGF